jgi:uncharacterized protein YndB with AHSA1/START domain
MMCNNKLRVRGHGARCINCKHRLHAGPLMCYRRLQIESEWAMTGMRRQVAAPARSGRDRILMAGLVIEREILIEAPPEVVWRTITEPDQMSLWFADRVELVVEPGAHGYMQFGDQGGPVVVETVDPPARFSFRWNHPSGEEPVTGNSMLVEFTLTPEGSEQTRLRVTESGHELLAWPDAEKQRYADEHRGGWAEYLDRLADIVSKRHPG